MASADSFDDVLKRLSNTTGASMSSLARLYRQGAISRETLQRLAESMLQVASVQGAAYGQLAYAQYAEAISGQLPQGVARPELAALRYRQGRIAKSVSTVLEYDDDDIEQRLAALGENFPVQVVQESYGYALVEDDNANGWVRGLEPDGCQLCQWWWRDGRVWPKDHAMPTHPGCRCQQLPTFSEYKPVETGYTRALNRRNEALERAKIARQHTTKTRGN